MLPMPIDIKYIPNMVPEQTNKASYTRCGTQFNQEITCISHGTKPTVGMYHTWYPSQLLVCTMRGTPSNQMISHNHNHNHTE